MLPETEPRGSAIHECYPIATLPHLSRLFLDFAERRDPLAPFYPASAYSTEWMTAPAVLGEKHRAELCELLTGWNQQIGAGAQVFENIERLRKGAGAVVTGQQVTIFGGPLFTLLKAATAIRRAKDATVCGHACVPIFWLASEDHDLAEADHVAMPAGGQLRHLQITVEGAEGRPVGNLALGDGIQKALDEAEKILGPGPFLESLRSCYRPDATFSQAFAEWLTRAFAAEGLILIDASSRAFHALGKRVLHQALTRAGELQTALEDRGQALAAAGYHAQVLTQPQSSLLFLIDGISGARLALKRTPEGWQAGRQTYSTADLIAILDAEPERISPNALLRPVFQDAILPTAVYIGGPAEAAYFAQSQVLYERILGRTTPVQPRLSATLIEPEIASLLAQHDIGLPEIIQSALEDPQELAQRLGARAMPIETKQRLAAAGNALEEELTALVPYLHSLNEPLGKAAEVAGSKMRYQMNRLRRLAANFELSRNPHLSKHAQALQTNLFPDRHPQERTLGAAWFLCRYGDSLPSLLVEHAGQQCPGHKAIWL